jgi:hypothetical protein
MPLWLYSKNMRVRIVSIQPHFDPDLHLEKEELDWTELSIVTNPNNYRKTNLGLIF